MLKQMNARLGAPPAAVFSFAFIGWQKGQHRGFTGQISGRSGADQSGMTLNILIEAEQPTGFLDITEEWLREAGVSLGAVVEAIKAGEFGQIKDAQTAVRDLKAAVQLAIFEGDRVEKLRKTGASGVGSGQLDLHAARDEIGRRLACLRRAGAGG